MSDYDKMSVHDLVEVLLDYVNSGAGWYTNGGETPAIESALRRAVLREAAVGEVKVVTTEHFDEIARPEDPERIVTMSEQIVSKAWVPEGKYWLVKEE